MRRFAFCLAIVVAAITGNVHAHDGMISSAAIEPIGLTVEWFNQVDVGPNGKVVDIHLDVNEDKATTYFATKYGSTRTVISQNHLNAFGEPMGVDGAEKYVNERKQILEMELAAAGRKVDVTIEKYTLPKSTLYTMTSSGVVTALDADTGQHLWTAEVGTSRLPSIGLGSSHEYVAAVNGSNVYLIDATNGKVIWERPCKGAIGSSPAVNSDYVYVPMVSGHVLIFPINKEGLGTSRFVAAGHCMARPLTTGRTVSWPTDLGHYYVAYENSESKMQYRLITERPIVAGGAHKDGSIFVGSMDGFIYSMDEITGSLHWEYSTGDHISKSPIPLGEAVYVITQEGEMFKIDTKRGLLAEGWREPLQGISGFIGATDQNLYLQGKFGDIQIFDRKTAKSKGLIRTNSTNLVLENKLTDRLFVGNENGLIQCIRELGSPTPKFHHGQEILDDPVKPVESDGPMEEKVQQEDDPFKKPGAAADPFKKSGGGDPFKTGGASDPFKSGGGGDPFKTGGGGSKKADDDPFKTGGGGGAKDDPFGGGRF